mmetsp:Transcript_12265/g.33672  ORF Transcript_12265/g.33672 Transcript_12265/m.33672 type:complete len:209 (+) Transcript_12265:1407-2033(+)
MWLCGVDHHRLAEQLPAGRQLHFVGRLPAPLMHGSDVLLLLLLYLGALLICRSPLRTTLCHRRLLLLLLLCLYMLLLWLLGLLRVHDIHCRRRRRLALLSDCHDNIMEQRTFLRTSNTSECQLCHLIGHWHGPARSFVKASCNTLLSTWNSWLDDIPQGVDDLTTRCSERRRLIQKQLQNHSSEREHLRLLIDPFRLHVCRAHVPWST